MYCCDDRGFEGVVCLCGDCEQDGTTALFVAVRGSHDSIVKILLGARANMNCVLRDGTTPLYYACDKGDTAIVKALLSAPSELNPNLARAVCTLDLVLGEHGLCV